MLFLVHVLRLCVEPLHNWEKKWEGRGAAGGTDHPASSNHVMRDVFAYGCLTIDRGEGGIGSSRRHVTSA